MKNLLFLVTFIFVPKILSAQFIQNPLPYSYDDLEPFVDAETTKLHYSKHHAAYVNNLNAAVAGTPIEKLSLNEILAKASTMSSEIRNNAGGHYNHELYWTVLTPEENTKASTELENAINETFGSLDLLKEKLTTAGISVFGSGWAWLIVTNKGKLAVCSTQNQDNPLMDIATIKGTPIFAIDVWEHAYYLDYLNKKNDYLSTIWNVVNWTEISKRYHDAITNPDKFAFWPEIKSFHKVISHTFYPSEEGNLQPVKEKSSELLENAFALKTSNIPTEYLTRSIVTAVNKLAIYSKSLDKLVKSNATDEKITKALNNLHNEFHTLLELCSLEDNL